MDHQGRQESSLFTSLTAPLLGVLLGMGLTCLCLSSSEASEEIRPLSSDFDPAVITPDYSLPVTFKMMITGSPSRVEIVKGTTTFQLAPRGDGEWVISLDPGFVLSEYRDLFNKIPVGIYQIYDGDEVVVHGPVNIDVLTPNIPRLLPARMGPDIQFTPNLVNILSPGALETLDIVKTREIFYQYFPGRFDFLNIIFYKGYHMNRYHMIVRNEVGGIGLRQFDNRISEREGRLQGITVFPQAYLFHGADRAYSHELGHQWINHLGFYPFNAAGGAHWPIGSLARSIMGYNLPQGGQGLQFPYDLIPNTEGFTLRRNNSVTRRFHDIDLYLMGLIAAEEASTQHIILVDQYQDPGSGFLSGPVVEAGVKDIIERLGPRTPNVYQSQKQYNVATVVVSDRFLSEDEMSLYDFYSKEAEAHESRPAYFFETSEPFYLATNGLASLTTSIQLFEHPSFPALGLFSALIWVLIVNQRVPGEYAGTHPQRRGKSGRLRKA